MFQHRIQDLMLSIEDVNKIDGLLSKLNKGPMGSSVRLQLTVSKTGDTEALKGLGTYGMIRNPAGFVIGAVQPTDAGMIDFGYQMESIILTLMDMGIGTCWLGGSFKQSRFAECIGVQHDEHVPAVISLGYPTDKRHMMDRFVRFAAGSKKRKSWDDIFFQKDFKTTLSPKALDSYSQVLEMMRLAPSASNRQPWRIVHDPDKNMYHLFLLRSRAYDPKNVGMADLQMADMGIAMSHFSLTAVALNRKGDWVVEDPKLEDLLSGTEYVITWKASH